MSNNPNFHLSRFPTYPASFMSRSNLPYSVHALASSCSILICLLHTHPTTIPPGGRFQLSALERYMSRIRVVAHQKSQRWWCCCIGRTLGSGSTAMAVSGGTLRLVASYGTCLGGWRPGKLVDPSVAGNVSCGWGQEVQANGSPQPEEALKPKDVVLFQYELCPSGGKVSAFLDYYKIPYKGVHVTPISKKEIKWSDYKKLPIFTVDGELMVDSSDMINKLVRRVRPDYDLNADDEEKKWREWVDNYLVHVVLANTYGTFSEALDSFDYVAPEVFDILGFATDAEFPRLSLSERLVRATAMFGGAAAMYCVSKISKRKHNISDEREALYGAAERWVDDGLNGRKFLGGWNNPNLADLAVYGALSSIHTFKSGIDMLEHTRIGAWYYHMEEAIGGCYRKMGCYI